MICVHTMDKVKYANLQNPHENSETGGSKVDSHSVPVHSVCEHRVCEHRYRKASLHFHSVAPLPYMVCSSGAREA